MSPWTQTASGKAIDLLTPDSRAIDFENDVAPALAKIARFAGATRGDLPYTVAQHCVLGAEALFAETESHYLAAAFVLHDAHEYVLTDLPTPALQAFDQVFGPQYLGAFEAAVREVKSRLDAAIFEAAGLRLPTAAEHSAIRVMDARMMIAERNALMAKPPRSWRLESPLPANVDPTDLMPWDCPTAASEWLDALWCYVEGSRS